MKKQRLIARGNGMAGIRCIEHILKMNRDMFEIVIFGSEPHPNYNRILLSSVLQGEVSLDDITLNSREWYEKTELRFTREKRLYTLIQNGRLSQRIGSAHDLRSNHPCNGLLSLYSPHTRSR